MPQQHAALCGIFYFKESQVSMNDGHGKAVWGLLLGMAVLADKVESYHGRNAAIATPKKGASAKKKARAKKRAAQQLDNRPPDTSGPPFNLKNLPQIFEPQKWVGKTNEMERMWRKVPAPLKKKFNFSAALAEARQKTLKLRVPGKPVFKKKGTSPPRGPNPE